MGQTTFAKLNVYDNSAISLFVLGIDEAAQSPINAIGVFKAF